MGLYGNEKDYEEIIQDNIKKAKLLFSLSEEDQNLVLKLLDEKEKIKKKNGLFANHQLKNIDEKIQKIQKKYNK
jgi:hypothetical protein